MTEQQLYTKDLETQILEALQKQPVSFEQKNNDIDFSMPSMAGLKSVLKTGDSNLLVMAVGTALSSTVGGVVSGFTGNVGGSIAGFSTALGGVLLKMTVAKSGVLKDLANGVLLSGISSFVANLTAGGINFGGFGQKVQQEFKQEKPCDKTEIRDGVRW